MFERDKLERILATYIPYGYNQKVTYQQFILKSLRYIDDADKQAIIADSVMHNGIANTIYSQLVLNEFTKNFGNTNFHKSNGGNLLFSSEFYHILGIYVLTNDVNIALETSRRIGYDISKISLLKLPHDSQQMGHNLMNNNNAVGSSGCFGVLLILLIPIAISLLLL